MTPELERRWVPVATLWLPLDILVVGKVLDELARDTRANGHELVMTTDEGREDVLRLGYYVRVEP